MLATIAVVVTLYARGTRYANGPNSRSRHALFYLGIFLIYCALQTSWDYYASHMFFVHRLQHLVLHDIGPALLAAAAPAAEVMRGLPRWMGRYASKMAVRLRPVARMIFEPWTATALYIASLIVWIWPSVHFDVMLSNGLYRLMNRSVVLGDLPFWWLVLDPRPYPLALVRGGHRLLMLFVVMLPIMLAGAILGLSRHDWYTVYKICGRFTAVSASTDQHLGGLIIWIPGNALLGMVALFVLRRILYQERAELTLAGRQVILSD